MIIGSLNSLKTRYTATDNINVRLTKATQVTGFIDTGKISTANAKPRLLVSFSVHVVQSIKSSSQFTRPRGDSFKPKDNSFSSIDDEDNRSIFTLVKLEPENFLVFFLKKLLQGLIDEQNSRPVSFLSVA